MSKQKQITDETQIPVHHYRQAAADIVEFRSAGANLLAQALERAASALSAVEILEVLIWQLPTSGAVAPDITEVTLRNAIAYLEYGPTAPRSEYASLTARLFGKAGQ